MPDKAVFEMAERHLREAEDHVAKQMGIIDDLRRDGHPTADAEDLLRVFQDTLKSHEQHLATLRAEQDRN